VEVHPDGSKALELSLPRGVLAYRAYKFPWKETVSKPSFMHFEVREGNTYSFNDALNVTGVEITYNALSAADYNEAIITRIPYGPVNPDFIESIISVSPVSITYEVLAISSQSAEFHIDLDVYPEIKDPNNTVAYHRDFVGQGLFIPSPTSWDSANNELIVNLHSFGEIVFGVPEGDIDSKVPILYEPSDNEKLVLQDSITVKWTGKGLYNSFNVQVAADSNFTALLHESNTNLSAFSMKDLENNTRYFWRVNSEFSGESSEWSPVWSFEITDPYIQAISPNGGEIWYNGSREIVRWETNILDQVRIDLMQDQSLVRFLDTVPGNQQAYAWELASDLQTGDNYSIRISSESDPGISGISQDVFSIADTATGLGQYGVQLARVYSLDQNIPNPFYQSTRIAYALQKPGFVSLKVYNLIGEELHTLVSEFQEAGSYSRQFDAAGFSGGIYFYKLRIGDEYTETKKMILAR
jgi:hypothetical protein